MKTSFFFLACVFILLTSFRDRETIIEPGVYSLSVSTDHKILSAFEIRKDQTFVYFDKQQHIRMEGSWKISKGNLILQTEKQLPVSAKWKILKNGKCLKSRMKFAFYRLCNC